MKVVADVLGAGFYLIIQCAWLPLVGLRGRVTRYRHLSVVCLLGKCPRAFTAWRYLVLMESMVLVMPDHLPDLDVVGQEWYDTAPTCCATVARSLDTGRLTWW